MINIESLLIRPVMTRILSKTSDKWQEPFNVFLRTACVGNALIPRIFRPSRLSATYAQKCHVELLANLSKRNSSGTNSTNSTNSTDSLSVLGKNMKEWYSQTLKINFQKDFLEADFSLFDSFCELTDLKLEVAKDTWAYGHRQDFNLKPEKQELIEISVPDIEKYFIDILEKKMLISPNRPLIYLIYSSSNDSREKFKLRSNELLEMGQRLSVKYSCFKLLKLDPSEYRPSETSPPPYHYSRATIDKLAKNLALILDKAGVKTNKYLTRS